MAAAADWPAKPLIIGSLRRLQVAVCLAWKQRPVSRLKLDCNHRPDVVVVGQIAVVRRMPFYEYESQVARETV